MSRNIKFRLFDRQENKMLFEGFHVFGEVTLFNLIGIHALETKGEKNSLERYSDFEIMQFTGFLDSLKKEIWEGDVLKPFLESIGPYWVVFENGSFVCYHKWGRWGLLSRVFEPDLLKDYQVEVIGNIYESPELIQQPDKPL